MGVRYRDGKLRAPSPKRASRHFSSLIKGAVVWPVVFEQRVLTPREARAAIEEAVEMFLGYYAT